MKIGLAFGLILRLLMVVAIAPFHDPVEVANSSTDHGDSPGWSGSVNGSGTDAGSYVRAGGQKQTAFLLALHAVFLLTAILALIGSIYGVVAPENARFSSEARVIRGVKHAREERLYALSSRFPRKGFGAKKGSL